MLLIDCENLREEIEKSMYENPHKDPKINQNHYLEHKHFLNMLNKQSVVFDTEKVIKQIKRYKWFMMPGVFKRIVEIIRKGGKK